MMTLQFRNLELNEYFVKLSWLVICLLFILKVFDFQVSKRTQLPHFLKIGVVNFSKLKAHERESASRNPRAWLPRRAKLVTVNTAPFESIGPGTLSFTSITLSVLLSLHLKLSCLFLSAPLKLNFQTPSSHIRAVDCMIGEEVTSVREIVIEQRGFV